MKRKRANKFIMILAVLALAIVAGAVQIQDSPAFAEEQKYVTVDAALDVYMDDILVKTYSTDEFAALKESSAYTYSGFNTYPTAKTVSNACGVPVEKLLRDALGSGNFNKIADDQVIEFTARDAAIERFLKRQLFEQRWYYPQYDKEQGRIGQAVLEESKANAVKVQPMISVTEEGISYGESGNYDIGRLLFGQISPHDQNHAAFLKDLAPQKIKVREGREDTVKHSSIRVLTGAGTSWNPIEKNDTVVEIGVPVRFDLSVNDFNTNGSGRYWVYYTTDGSEPTLDSDMYNYNSYGGSGQAYNAPVFTEYGPVTVKTKVCGYGKEDSEVTTIQYMVGPQIPEITKLVLKKKTITVKWEAAEGAEGYEICRAMKKTGKYSKVKTIGDGTTVSWKDQGLKKGKKYFYKIRSFRAIDGQTVYSSYSAVKNKKIK